MWKETKAETIVKELGIDNIIDKELKDISDYIERRGCFRKQRTYPKKYLQELSSYFVSEALPENIQKVEIGLRKEGFKGDIEAFLFLNVVDYIVQKGVERRLIDKNMFSIVRDTYDEYKYSLRERKYLI